VAARIPTRTEQGLPEDAFVFCCLNGSQKFMPGMFQLWMHILKEVPDSVLWLLSSTKETDARIRLMAQNCGVAPERLVFAEKEPNPQHLARYRLADVFLDTFPYGAHTTAADALWMGVPVLAVPGRTFASRVCAGLVTAAGLPELVCKTPGDYAARAIALGKDRAKVAALRSALDAGRTTSLLFDTTRLVQSLEQLFGVMWADFESGRLPTPDLTNLDVYAELGVALNLDPQGGGGQDYRSRYEERLQALNRNYRLAADNRFWPGEANVARVETQRLKRVI
jgi:predicted O-linked N-acetylglucosamine transferase (SPINDLY family)